MASSATVVLPELLASQINQALVTEPLAINIQCLRPQPINRATQLDLVLLEQVMDRIKPAANSLSDIPSTILATPTKIHLPTLYPNTNLVTIPAVMLRLLEVLALSASTSIASVKARLAISPA